MLTPGDIIPLNWELRLLSDQFGHLMTLNQQTKRGILVLGGVNFQGTIDCCYTMKVERKMSGM